MNMRNSFLIKIKSWLAGITRSPRNTLICREESPTRPHGDENIENLLRVSLSVRAESITVPAGALLKVKMRIGEDESRPGKVSIRIGWRQLLRLFVLRRRVVLAGAVVTLAGIIVSLFLPVFGADSPEALAAEVAKSSPQMQLILAERGLEEIEARETVIGEEQALVIYQLDSNYVIVADVNLDTLQLIKLQDFELSDPVEKQISAFALESQLTRGLFESGGIITEYSLTYVVNQDTLTQADGSEYTRLSVSFLTPVKIELGGRQFRAIIDYSNATVIRVFEIPG